MSDYIELKAGAGVPASLADGEVAIDESAGNLYVANIGGVGQVPLDIGPVPTGGLAGQILVQGATALEWTVLSAGGGGRPFEALPWRVPGLAPVSTSSLSAHTPEIALFDLNKPATLKKIRLRALSGSGEVQVTIGHWTGAMGALVLDQAITIPAAGVYVADLSLALAAGRYAVYCAAVESVTPGALSLETIEGYLPWSGTIWRHPLSMSF